MKDPMRIVAAVEAATGVALMLYPPLVAQFLFGADIAGAGLAMARIGGTALVALGIACWPGASTSSPPRLPRLAMAAYSGVAALYLAFLALDGALRGPVMWPVAVFHLVASVLLAKAPGAPPRAPR